MLKTVYEAQQWSFVVACLVCAVTLTVSGNAAAATIEIGSSEEEVLSTLGKPTGTIAAGDSEIWSYFDALVEIKDGRVVSIDGNVTEAVAEGQEEKRFRAEQRKKGLVFYQGEWMTIKEKQVRLGKVPKRDEPVIRVLREGGKKVGLRRLLVRGKITVVDFYADWCGPCKTMSPLLDGLAQSEPDVYLRKVDIVNWGTPVVRQYSIQSVPNVRVYNRQGTIVGKPTSNIETVKKYIREAQ